MHSTQFTPSTNSSTTIIDDYHRFAEASVNISESAYHLPSWKKIFNTYRINSHWLVAERDSQSVGVLPLVRQSTRLFGHRFISLPWVDEAGAIGDELAVQALLEHAVKLVEENGPKFSLSIKQPVLSQHPALSKNWSLETGNKILMRRRLGISSDELWQELSPKVRNQVRKAEKNGLTTVRGGIELVGDFYGVYSYNMRDLGSPAHSLKFFEVLLDALGDRAEIYCTRLEGKVIGAGIVLDNRPSLDIPWASSLRTYNRLCVNHALYWQILSDACERGYEWFHFGRSTRGSGQHKFKKQWGAEELPLVWLHYSQQPKSTDLDNSASMQDKFGLAQRLWTKLPLPIAQDLGPHIIRHVP